LEKGVWAGLRIATCASILQGMRIL